MKCPKCGGKTTVMQTVTTDDETHRQKRCLRCEERFYTSEIIVPMSVDFYDAFAAKRARLKKEKERKAKRRKKKEE